MLILIIKICLTITLLPIATIHIYWFFGGQKGLYAAIPTQLDDIKQKIPKPLFTLLTMISLGPVIVILIFLMLSIYPVASFFEPYKLSIYYIFSILFIIRGSLGWVINLFSKNDIFNKKNITIYSPISLFIGILFFSLYKLHS